MRGKRAKQLRRLAFLLLKTHGIKSADGYNSYRQFDNCICWEPAYVDGKPHIQFNGKGDDPNANRIRLTDPDGNPLLARVRKPGTVVTDWKLQTIYQNLKKRYKRERANHLGVPDYTIHKKVK